MSTPFDFASVVLFGLIAVVFLHRSSKDEQDHVPLWAYGGCAVACAAGDVLANNGYVPIGLLLLFAAVASGVWIVVKKPGDVGRRG